MSTKIARETPPDSSRILGYLLSSKLHIDQPLTEVDKLTFFVAARQGVLPLLAHRLAPLEARLGLTRAIKDILQDAIRNAAALELSLRGELITLLDALRAAGVDTLLLKGAALAYTHYDAPYLRPRGDTDILIRVADKQLAHDALQRRGYVERPALASARVSQQIQYSRVLRTGVEHSIDLHWRTFNPSVFSSLLPFDELWEAHRTVPALGPAARTPGAVHTLLLSLLHRVAHHEPGDGLLWLFDIHLVAQTLSNEEWNVLVQHATTHDVDVLCAEGLDAARDAFSTPVPQRVDAWLAAQCGAQAPERFRVFQQSGRRVIDMVASDFRASSGWRDQVSLVREHLMPPASYMKARYGVRSDWFVPFLYAYRASAGAWRWFRRDLFR